MDTKETWAQTESSYADMLVSDPLSYDVWIRYGRILQDQGRLQQAEAAYRRAIGLEPRRIQGHLRLGQVLNLQNKAPEAIEVFDALLQITSDDLQAPQGASGLLPSKETALSTSTVLTPNPTHPFKDKFQNIRGESNDLTAEEWIAEGDFANNKRNWLCAAEAYAKALEKNPTLSHVWIQYGHCLKEQGFFPQAEVAYRRAELTAPDGWDPKLQLGHLLKRLGRRGEAISYFKSLLQFEVPRLEASRELEAMGVDNFLTSQFEVRFNRGDVDAIAHISDELTKIRNVIEKIEQVLPDISAQNSWPLSLYSQFRKMHSLQPPPGKGTPSIINVLLTLDSQDEITVWDQLNSIFSQSDKEFVISAFGGTHIEKSIVERMKHAVPRLNLIYDEPSSEPTAYLERVISSIEKEWVVLLAAGGILDRRALDWFGFAASQNDATDAWICDEEWTSRNLDAAPNLEMQPEIRQIPDYDYALDFGAEGQTLLVRRSCLLDIVVSHKNISLEVLRNLVFLDLARKKRIKHIPFPLVSRSIKFSQIPTSAHLDAIDIHAAQYNIGHLIEYNRTSSHLPVEITWKSQVNSENITVIISTRDNIRDLAALIGGMRALSAVPSAVSFIIVDNGSVDPDAIKHINFLDAEDDILVLRIDEPFNWSRLNNIAVSYCKSKHIIFANDDMAAITQSWDNVVRGLLDRKDVGMVGAMLFYPDDSIQHAGIIFNSDKRSVHDGLHVIRSDLHLHKRYLATRSVSAVTGAFLAVRREDFIDFGGFDEIHMPVAHSDVDFAMKVRAAGLKVIWTPRLEFYHYESKTRGFDHLSTSSTAREISERSVLQMRWGEAMGVEPSLSPVWVRSGLPCRRITTISHAALCDYLAMSRRSEIWAPESPLHNG
jgi:GT2 family glycosyltransferase/tetratricopeptide (TPR) repeat protein